MTKQKTKKPKKLKINEDRVTYDEDGNPIVELDDDEIIKKKSKKEKKRSSKTPVAVTIEEYGREK